MSSSTPATKKRKTESAKKKRKVRTVTCREGETVHFTKLILLDGEELKLDVSGGKLTIDVLQLANTARFKHDFSGNKNIKIGKVAGGITQLTF